MHASKGLSFIAAIEALKGVLVLVAGFGLLTLIHHDVHAMAEAVVRRFHLNPAHEIPKVFLQAAGTVNDSRIWFLAACAGAYATVRLVEAYGLWKGRHWAEWFAAVSSGIYIPLEISELAHGITWAKAAILVVNMVVLIYMIWVLMKGRGADQTRIR